MCVLLRHTICKSFKKIQRTQLKCDSFLWFWFQGQNQCFRRTKKTGPKIKNPATLGSSPLKLLNFRIFPAEMWLIFVIFISRPKPVFPTHKKKTGPKIKNPATLGSSPTKILILRIFSGTLQWPQKPGSNLQTAAADRQTFLRIVWFVQICDQIWPTTCLFKSCKKSVYIGLLLFYNK